MRWWHIKRGKFSLPSNLIVIRFSFWQQKHFCTWHTEGSEERTRTYWREKTFFFLCFWFCSADVIRFIICANYISKLLYKILHLITPRMKIFFLPLCGWWKGKFFVETLNFNKFFFAFDNDMFDFFLWFLYMNCCQS